MPAPPSALYTLMPSRSTMPTISIRYRRCRFLPWVKRFNPCSARNAFGSRCFGPVQAANVVAVSRPSWLAPAHQLLDQKRSATTGLAAAPTRYRRKNDRTSLPDGRWRRGLLQGPGTERLVVFSHR